MRNSKSNVSRRQSRPIRVAGSDLRREEEGPAKTPGPRSLELPHIQRKYHRKFDSEKMV